MQRAINVDKVDVKVIQFDRLPGFIFHLSVPEKTAAWNNQNLYNW